MTATAQRIFIDALTLTPIERAKLIDGLLHSFDPGPDQSQVDAWKAEARIDAYEAGLVASGFGAQERPERHSQAEHGERDTR
jgi:hypothetical protein